MCMFIGMQVCYGHRVVKGMCYVDNLWVLMGGRWVAHWYAESVCVCVCV